MSRMPQYCQISFQNMRLQLTIICLLLLATQCVKPRSKRQQGVWRAECELGIISDPDCPVDGGWSPWGPWSTCQGLCDDIGHRRRTRECNNPTTSKDGIPCNGPDEQIETCYITNCTVADYRALIKGDFARTSALKQLEALPALLERCLQMDCHYDAIESALSRDNTWQLNTETIWNALQCVKFNLGCPMAGGWSSWGVWSACGARCGWGRQWRLRRCDNPPPSAANLICDGSPLQANVCEGLQCSLGETGTWGAWGPWSGCSEPCGTGVRRRRRVCNVKRTPNAAGIWGTPCIGQHDELDTCSNNNDCVLNGGWSGWGPWTACSQSCGAGRRARSRSCTRPIPNDDGVPCVGQRTEIGSCHLAPCQVYLHTVAMLNGESFIHFNFENKRSTFFHFFIRFKPLSPHGTLVRRGDVHNPLVRMSLQNWHVCVDANGQAKSCSLERICAPIALEADAWHSVLVTVTTESVILRIDDASSPIKGTFLCDPELPDAKMKVWIGEKLHGEIQEIILNFIPLKLKIKHERKRASSFYPYSASNIIYDKSTLEEAFLTLTDDQYLRLPCFVQQKEWQMELTFKPRNNVGTLLLLEDEYQKNWLVVSLHNMRLKLRLALGEYRSESTTSTDYLPDQWIDVTLSKKNDTNTVEALINGQEKLHVMIGVDNRTNRAYYNATRKVQHDVTRPHNNNSENSFHICSNEFYVGGIPEDATPSLKEDFTPFSGVLASLSINKVFLDLHDFSVERTKDNKVQVSSRTASVSGLYHETGWGKSNRLNLTCLHARTLRSPYSAHWLYLDTGIRSVINDKNVRSVDDGRVLRLDASADNDLRGFYTCRALTNGRTRNIVTYGILGKVRYQLSSPDTVTAVALFTTITLVIVALATLVMEGINDLRNGYGFFRDRHLSPQEECECVCTYIEENADFFGSESAIKCAKAKAQNKSKEIISRMNFGAQEPEGITEVRKRLGKCILESPSDNALEMPSLKGSIADPANQYKCDQSYVSSPRHGSEISAQSGRKITSTTCSVALSLSPRLICSKLLLSKKLLYSSSKESLVSRARNKGKSNLQSKSNLSPGQKVLQRFRELNNDD